MTDETESLNADSGPTDIDDGEATEEASAFDPEAFRVEMDRQFSERFVKPAQRLTAQLDEQVRQLRDAADEL
jgi:hypothetical protein